MEVIKGHVMGLNSGLSRVLYKKRLQQRLCRNRNGFHVSKREYRLSVRSAADPNRARAESAMAAALKYAKKNKENGGGTGKDFSNLSQEQITKKINEENEKDGIVTEVEMITKEGDYRPKVSTWGMFPRPENISKAYGGGRTLKQGEPLESDADKQARAQRVQASIAKYRQNAGLIVDEAVVKVAKVDFSNGEALMADGRLEQAIPFFSKVIEAMPKKSRLFGEASLQRALCLDSLGKLDEAREEYKLLVRHPAPDVAKRSNQMLEGFESMEFLKADQFDFMTQRNAYGGYLQDMSKRWDTGTWNSAYVNSNKDEEEAMSPALLAAVLVSLFVFPLGLVAGLALR